MITFLALLRLHFLAHALGTVNLRELVEKINAANATWQARYYTFWEESTISLHLGAFLDDPGFDEIPKVDLASLKDLPSAFHSYQKWPNCESILEVRDQSSCGSCWAVSVASVMTDRLCIKSDQTDKRRISAEDLLSCCGINCGYGCEGGYPSGAWKYAKIVGIVTGQEFGNTYYCRPYSLPPCNHHSQPSSKYQTCAQDIFLKSKLRIDTPRCEKSCHKESGRNYAQDLVKVSQVLSFPTAEAIMRDIYEHGPVQATFQVYEDFLSYSKGVYEYRQGKYLGGHAVKIIGWGEANGVPYWEVMNSWNDEWGMRGIFWIKRGENHLGIESQAMAGI